MKINSLKCVCAIGALATTLTASAGGLQSAHVMGDPGWVIHVDCDALKQTALGKFILDEMDKPEAQKKLTAFQTVFDVDPRKQLHGLTLYSSSKSQEDGVLLVYADIDVKRLTTLAEGAKEHESTTHGKHTIHSWIDENKAKKDGGKPRTYSAIHNGKVLVFSQKEAPIANALDVLDGAKPNLSQNKSYARLGSSGQSFLVGAASKVDLPQNDPNAAAVLKQTKMFWLSAGEAKGNVDINLSIETENEEVAKNIESIGKGLVGLLALQKDKPDSAKIAQGLSINQSSAEVTAKLSLPSDQIVGMIQKKPAKKAEN
jgi:hypothetical protein